MKASCFWGTIETLNHMTFDLITLLAKFFIYTCKIQKKNMPQFPLFKRDLKTAFEVEKYIAAVNMSYDNLVLDWHFCKDLMEA